ncbi:unnamed protein product, partial [Iphiclides podalirius]
MGALYFPDEAQGIAEAVSFPYHRRMISSHTPTRIVSPENPQRITLIKRPEIPRLPHPTSTSVDGGPPIVSSIGAELARSQLRGPLTDRARAGVPIWTATKFENGSLSPA